MQITDFLKEIPLFQKIPREEIEHLASKGKKIRVAEGEFLVRELEKNKGLFFILDGRLGLFSEKGNNFLGERGRGDFLGEGPLLTDTLWKYDILALRDSEILFIPSAAIFSLFSVSEEIMVSLIRNMVKDLEDQKPRIHEFTRIAIIPLAEDLKNFQTFLEKFTASLQKHGKVLTVTNQKTKEFFKWLLEKEKEFRWILLIGDPSHYQWTKRIMHGADRILFVAPLSKPTIDSPIKKKTFDRKTELIFLHSSKHNSTASAWLKLYPTKVHYHVRIDIKPDYERLIRILTGKSIGLVLSSGGVRSFAHIGILKALEDARIPIDQIGGSSFGSFFAALYASGIDVDHIYEIGKKIFSSLHGCLDYTFPYLSLIKGARVEKILLDIFKDLKIEDLWLPFFCVSSDLNAGKTFVHSQGLLWKAIRASISFPGVLPPVWEKDELLVDGSLSNVMPIDVMQNIYDSSKIIGVDVDLAQEEFPKGPFPPFVSGWKILFKKLNPFVRSYKIPNIFTTLLRSVLLDSSNKKQNFIERKQVDLFIQPPLENFHNLEFKSFKAIYKKSYRYGLENIEKWQEILNHSQKSSS